MLIRRLHPQIPSREGYFGGGYTSIGPGPYYQRRGAGRSAPFMSVEPMYTVPPIIMARAMSTAPTIGSSGDFCAGLRRRHLRGRVLHNSRLVSGGWSLALPPEADIRQRIEHVRLCQKLTQSATRDRERRAA